MYGHAYIAKTCWYQIHTRCKNLYKHLYFICYETCCETIAGEAVTLRYID